MSEEPDDEPSPDQDAEILVELFHDGVAYAYVRADEHTGSHFGGPLEVDIAGEPPGPRPLHHLARLSWPAPGVFHPLPPLIYGFNFDGCELRYRMHRGRIEILELDPVESSDDFPYRDYPTLIPYVPLKMAEARRTTYGEFAEAYPNLAPDQPAPMIAVIPPPATIGMSLWGGNGDAEGVTVVFEIDPVARVVRAYNRCS